MDRNRKEKKPKKWFAGLKKRLGDLLYGAGCAFRGLFTFYSRPRLWPYAVPPLICVILVYAVLLTVIILLVNPWLIRLIDGCTFPFWLSWLQMLLHWGRFAIVWIVFPLLLLGFIGSVYEMFGNMMFDLLVDAFEKKEFPEHPGMEQTYREKLRRTSGYLLLTVLSHMIKLPLMPLLLIPYFGATVYYVYASGICGRSYFHDSAIRQGFDVPVLRKQVGRNFYSMMGFGLVARFLEPFPFLIPGLVIGGSILYHTRFLAPAEENQRPEEISLPGGECVPLPASADADVSAADPAFADADTDVPQAAPGDEKTGAGVDPAPLKSV